VHQIFRVFRNLDQADQVAVNRFMEPVIEFSKSLFVTLAERVEQCCFLICLVGPNGFYVFPTR
jgi:hypothetical protein